MVNLLKLISTCSKHLILFLKVEKKQNKYKEYYDEYLAYVSTKFSKTSYSQDKILLHVRKHF